MRTAEKFTLSADVPKNPCTKRLKHNGEFLWSSSHKILGVNDRRYVRSLRGVVRIDDDNDDLNCLWASLHNWYISSFFNSLFCRRIVAVSDTPSVVIAFSSNEFKDETSVFEVRSWDESVCWEEISIYSFRPWKLNSMLASVDSVELSNWTREEVAFFMGWLVLNLSNLSQMLLSLSESCDDVTEVSRDCFLDNVNL